MVSFWRSLRSRAVSRGAPPFRSLASWEYMPFALSNLIPISDEFHWQYEQHRMKGPAGWPPLPALSGAASRLVSVVVSRETVVRCPTQMGHWKQLRVHLERTDCQ